MSGMKLGVQNFQVYLAGRPFQSQRDHHSLVWLDRLKGSNSIISLEFVSATISV